MKTRIRIWLLMGFISALGAYSFYEFVKPIWDGCFYHLIAFAFFCYTRVIFLGVRSPTALKLALSGSWKIPVLIIHLSTISALFDELYCDPKKLEINEYISFGIMIVIVLIQRKRWTR